MFSGKPYPLVITSQPEGNYPYEYTMSWAKPETGGNAIKEYRFKIRRVSNGPVTPVTTCHDIVSYCVMCFE